MYASVLKKPSMYVVKCTNNLVCMYVLIVCKDESVLVGKCITK